MSLSRTRVGKSVPCERRATSCHRVLRRYRGGPSWRHSGQRAFHEAGPTGGERLTWYPARRGTVAIAWLTRLPPRRAIRLSLTSTWSGPVQRARPSLPQVLNASHCSASGARARAPLLEPILGRTSSAAADVSRRNQHIAARRARVRARGRAEQAILVDESSAALISEPDLELASSPRSLPESLLGPAGWPRDVGALTQPARYSHRVGQKRSQTPYTFRISSP